MDTATDALRNIFFLERLDMRFYSTLSKMERQKLETTDSLTEFTTCRLEGGRV